MPVRLVLLIAAALLWLAACQGSPPRQATTAGSEAGAVAGVTPSLDEIREAYRQLAQEGGQVYGVDPARSKLHVYVYRGGLAARLGHNHVLSAPRFDAYVHVPDDNPARARFDLLLPLNALVVDDPQQRAEVGGSFAGERSASDISGTRRNMLGERGLHAEQYPLVHIKSVAIAGDWPVLLADVAITHGAGKLTVTGSLSLRQTDFGIEPFSLFGGVLSVQDAVAMEFALSAALAKF
jgi:hypothetical protein